jgi:hypothetical protein
VIVQPAAVPCVTLDEDAGDYTRLIAMETPDGIMGCDEAFQVMSEYNESPFGQTDGDTTVVSGWTCVTTAHPNYPAELTVFCTDGTLFEEEGPADGRLFLTLPAVAFAEEQAEEPQGQPAEEGAGVEIPVMEHLDNPGVASCDEAQQVVTELQNAVNVGTDLGNDVWLLPSGWVCGGIVHPDYPDEQTLYCDSGYVEEVGEFVDGLVIYTQPAGR